MQDEGDRTHSEGLAGRREKTGTPCTMQASKFLSLPQPPPYLHLGRSWLNGTAIDMQSAEPN